jgi:hypothetical protein
MLRMQVRKLVTCRSESKWWLVVWNPFRYQVRALIWNVRKPMASSLSVVGPHAEAQLCAHAASRPPSNELRNNAELNGLAASEGRCRTGTR